MPPASVNIVAGQESSAPTAVSGNMVPASAGMVSKYPAAHAAAAFVVPYQSTGEYAMTHGRALDAVDVALGVPDGVGVAVGLEDAEDVP